MSVSFVRTLGNESGIQLNPLVDGSGIPDTGTDERSFATAIRTTRGRIDKAFAVTSSSFFTMAGYGETVRSNALNEGWVHVYEALANGAYQGVLSRLIGDDAALSWIILSVDASGKISYSVENDTTNNHFMAIKHLECFNDGIRVSVHADELRENGKNGANPVITLRIYDANDTKIYEFKGSLIPTAKDDYGNSYYLPDVIETSTDAIEISMSDNAPQSISTSSNAYGFNDDGKKQWAESDLLTYFSEGKVGNYTSSNYKDACDRLEKTQLGFKYIVSGGSQNTSLLTSFVNLSYNINKQFRFDIDGSLSPEDAISFIDSLSLSDATLPHLVHAYWTPLKTNDPSGVNGRGYFGTSALNVGFACKRNKTKDSNGFAKMNYPIAGKGYPLNRKKVVQTYTPTNKELSQLAAAKINPVIYETYTDGGYYVFWDSLTCAPVSNSLRKLIAVADMSCAVDDSITAKGKELLQLPMSVALDGMKKYLKKYFEAAQAAGWIVASSDEQMAGAAFKYEAYANPDSPYDQIIVNYWVRYDGTNRQMFMTQTLTK